MFSFNYEVGIFFNKDTKGKFLREVILFLLKKLIKVKYETPKENSAVFDLF